MKECDMNYKYLNHLGDNSCGSRWGKAMSPSSMQLPTMSTWDLTGGRGQAASPFTMTSGQGM